MTAPTFNSHSFKNPDKSYRPAPFWSLNGDLQSKHLEQQIKDFKEIGFGGYFMHPRPGLKTPYLKDEWFECVKFMVETGKNEDMEPWLYDEDSFPSGFASGAVPAARPDLRAHALCLVTPEQLEEHPCVVAEYASFNKSGNTPIEQSDKDHATVSIIASRSIEGSAWYNNQCYVDTLNPDTVKCFLDSTHEKYAEKFKTSFGSLIPGVFTDEPHHSPEPAAGTLAALPWTPSLPKAFLDKYGYDLIPNLHGLFFETDDCQAVRFDYFNLVNSMFVTNFCKPMYDWCNEHGLELTGHFWEHSYPQVTGQASILTALKYMHRPGIDLLGKDVDKFSFHEKNKKLPFQVGNWQMVKAAGSVARQYGFDRVMSETWGGCGWDQTLEDHKQSADWEMLLGINFIVPHLSHYTLEGYRKTDYPISFTRSLPYWKQLHFLNDHIARVSYAMSCGETPTQILVIHPASHNWVNYNDEINLNRHACELEKLTRWLNVNQYEFDFGDEPLLAENGWVQNGKIGIAKMGYDTVIIPPTCCLHTSTLKKLEQFQNSGGTLINFGETIPQLANGRKNASLDSLFTNQKTEKASNFKQLNRILKSKVKRLLQLESSHQKIMNLTRVSGSKTIFFLANFAEEADGLTMHFSDTGKLYFANTETGDLTPVAINDAAVGSYSMKLEGGESRLLILDITEEPYQADIPQQKPVELQKAEGSFAFQCLDPNILLLDHCQYAFNSESFSETVQVDKALALLKERYNFEYSQGIRYSREYSHPEYSCSTTESFNMLFSFSIAENANVEKAKLAVEVPQNWKITVNGKNVSQLTDDFFMDQCFGVIDIGKYLKTGKNEITMTASVSRELTPANIFILGDFAVNLEQPIPAITQTPGKIDLNDITNQGYPFFGGRILYNIPFSLSTKQDNLILQLNQLNAPIINCKLDGHYKGKLFEAPYQLSLGCVDTGRHMLEITLYTHLKNVFGPHYVKPAEDQVIITCPMYNHIHEDSGETDLIITPCGVAPSLSLLGLT